MPGSYRPPRYPEIGLYWEKSAYEEAEHAAKFAELLGEVVTDSTRKNLKMRVEAENGATAGKTELAKQLNLAASHDTVHEMAEGRGPIWQGFRSAAQAVLWQVIAYEMRGRSPSHFVFRTGVFQMLEEILAAWLPPVLLLFIGLLVRYESKIADKRGRPNRSRFVWYFVDKDLAKKHPDQMYTEDRKVNRHWTSEK